MRFQLHDKLKGRRLLGEDSWGLNGVWEVLGPGGIILRIIASDGEEPYCQGWEHVSVSTQQRIPTWQEMCFVKDLFWDDEETVVQFHPPKSEYINYHPRTLHLWKYRQQAMICPPAILVGPRDSNNPTAEEKEVMDSWNNILKK